MVDKMSRFKEWFSSLILFGAIIVGLCYAWDYVTQAEPRLHGQVTQYIILRLAALCLCLPAIVGAWLYIDSYTEGDWFELASEEDQEKCQNMKAVVLAGKIVLLAVSLYVVGWILTAA